MFRSFLCSCLLLASLAVAQAANENRIWLDAKINNQPVKLIFDTGCDTAMLFRSTAERLHLQIIEPPANTKVNPGKVLTGYTEFCDLKLFNQNIQTRFNIVNVPAVAGSEVEGMIGWPPLRSNILEFDAKKRRIVVFGKLPPKTKDWQKFAIRKNAGVLILEIPRIGGGSDSIMVDTGSGDEVSLAPKIWKKWKADHPDDAFTLTAYYMPGSGTIIAPVMWAPVLNLGPIELHNVLIKEANITEINGVGPNFMANLPMEALERKGLIVDGKEGYAYIAPGNNVPDDSTYNRLGAVFVPETPESNNLIAHVASNSPAERAGIRDGDILIKIGSRDLTNWRTDPKPKGPPFTEGPEGTKLTMILKRNDVPYETTALLEEILRPSDEKPRLWQKAMRWVREHKPEL